MEEIERAVGHKDGSTLPRLQEIGEGLLEEVTFT